MLNPDGSKNETLLILSTNRQTCLTKCKESQYIDFSVVGQEICQNCAENCLTCTGSSSNCLSCNGFYTHLASNNSCLLKCPERMYAVGQINSFECENCIPNCLKCNGLEACEMCDNDNSFFIYQTNGRCGSCSVEEGMYLNKENNVCIACHQNCLTCYSREETSCLSCKEPRTLKSTGVCEPVLKNPISVLNTTWDNITFIVKVNFNQFLRKHYYDETFEKLLYDDNDQLINSTGKFTNQGSNYFKYKVEFTSDKLIRNGTMRFVNKNPLLISSSTEISSYFYGNITISGINNEAMSLKAAAESIKGSAGFVIKLISIVATVTALSSAVVLIKLFQMIDYLMLLSVIQPNNVLLMVGALSQNLLSDIPNLFTQLSDECDNLPELFEFNGMSCHLFGNIGSLILILLVLLCIKFMIWVWALRTTRWDRLWAYQIPFDWVSKKISHEFFLNVLNMFQLDIYVAIWILFYTYKGIESKNDTFNLWSSIASLIFLLLTPIFLKFARDKTEIVVNELTDLEKKEEEGKHYDGLSLIEIEVLKDQKMDRILTLRYCFWNYFKFLLTDLNSVSWYGKYYHAITMLRDPLLSFWLVFLNKYPSIQVSGITLIVLVFFTLECIYHPLTPHIPKFFALFNPFIYTILNLFYIYLSFTSPLSNSESSSSPETLGWLIIAFLVLLMSLNVLVSFLTSLSGLYMRSRALGRWLVGKRRVNRVGAVNARAEGDSVAVELAEENEGETHGKAQRQEEIEQEIEARINKRGTREREKEEKKEKRNLMDRKGKKENMKRRSNLMI